MINGPDLWSDIRCQICYLIDKPETQDLICHQAWYLISRPDVNGLTVEEFCMNSKRSMASALILADGIWPVAESVTSPVIMSTGVLIVRLTVLSVLIRVTLVGLNIAYGATSQCSLTSETAVIMRRVLGPLFNYVYDVRLTFFFAYVVRLSQCLSLSNRVPLQSALASFRRGGRSLPSPECSQHSCKPAGSLLWHHYNRV